MTFNGSAIADALQCLGSSGVGREKTTEVPMVKAQKGLI